MLRRLSTGRASTPSEDAPPDPKHTMETPLAVQFLQHLVQPGGYGFDEDDVRVGVTQWREAEIVAMLVRNVRAKAPDAVMGRIFTAVNQDGVVVLIGEASEPDDWDLPPGVDGGGGRRSIDVARERKQTNGEGVDGSHEAADNGGEQREYVCITDCHLSVVTLEPPVNLGAPDGRLAHVVMLVMVPEDDLTAPWAQGRDDTMRTIKSAMKRLAAHGAFLKMLDRAQHMNQNARSRQDFAKLFGTPVGTSMSPSFSMVRRKSSSSRLSFDARKSMDGKDRKDGESGRYNVTRAELVELLQASIEIFAKSEETRLRAIAEGKDITAQPEENAKELYQYSGRFAGGVINDIKDRYLPHFYSDWTDGFSTKTISATLLMYFACLAPCIAFGALANLETGGKMGTMEYLVAQGLSGIVFSLFAGQPEIVLRTTGPTTVFIIELSRVCDKWDLPFITTLGWVGIWTSIFLVVIALTDMCVPILRNCTRFTQEIFGLFVSAIFISAGGNALFIKYFKDEGYDLSHALMSLLLGLLTLQLGLWALAVRSSPFLIKSMREFMADFGIATAIAVGTLTAWGSGVEGLEMLAMSDTIEPSGGRSWLVNLTSGPSWVPAFAIVPAVLLTLLMYVEMSISSLLANKGENKLHKGPAFHLNFLVMALLVLVFSFFGLPFMTGSLPHSPQFIRALSDVEEISVAGQTRTRVMWVRENRLAPLFVSVLILLSLVMVGILKEIPMAVLYGLFLYMGVTGMATSQFWTRIKMIFMDPRRLPPTHYVRRVPISRVHAFTGVQLACLGVLLGVRASPAALFFPLFIAALMPLRMMLTKVNAGLFTKSMLKMLDLIGEGSNAETAGEDDLAHLGVALGASDWEEDRKTKGRRRVKKMRGTGAEDADDGKPTDLNSMLRRPSYLDLAEVGPDINGAHLMATHPSTPTSPPKSPSASIGDQSMPASPNGKQTSPGRMTTTSQVVINMTFEEPIGKSGGSPKK